MMPGVRGIAVKSIRYIHIVKKSESLKGVPFLKILLFILGFFFLNRNDVEFDFSIGYALVLFPLL